MKKLLLFFSFIFFCLSSFGQIKICSLPLTITGTTSSRIIIENATCDTTQSMTVGNFISLYGLGGGGGGGLTSVTIGNLSPLFTMSVSGTSTLAFTHALSNSFAYKVFGRGTSTGVPSYVTLDTNYFTNFSTYIRPLLSANSPLTYNSATGVFSADTNIIATKYYVGTQVSGLSFTSPLHYSAGVVTITAIPNATLLNSSVTINGNSLSLGGTLTLNKVDTIYKNATGDSIISEISGRRHAIKDSSGGSGGTVDTTGGDTKIATHYFVRTTDSVGTIVAGIWHGTAIDSLYSSHLFSSILRKPGSDSIFGYQNGTKIFLFRDTVLSVTEAQVTNLTSDLALKAPTNSPTFTGAPTAPTNSPNDNSAKIATTAYVDNIASAGSYYKVCEAQGTITATNTSASYYFASNGSTMRASGTSGATGCNVYYLQATDQVSPLGKATKFRITFIVTVNNAAPTSNFTVGLYPVTNHSGAAAATLNYDLGTVIGSSTATITTPAANSISASSTANFDLPADGVYAIGVATNSTIATSSHVGIVAYLEYSFR